MFSFGSLRAFCNSLMAIVTAPIACEERRSRCARYQRFTCLRIATASRTVLENNQRVIKYVEGRVSRDEGRKTSLRANQSPALVFRRPGPNIRSCFQHFNKSFLRDVDVADGFHPLFAFLLLFQQLALARDVAAVTFRCHVLAERADVFRRDDFTADGRLNFHLELLARDDLLELFRQRASPALRLAAMDNA